MPEYAKLRQDLSAPALYAHARKTFEQIKLNKSSRGIEGSDILMSGLAVFALKFSSLLQFDKGRADPAIEHNLRTLFGIKQAPCDSHLREYLDQVDPNQLRVIFKQLFALFQRGKGLESFNWLEGHYLLSIDGTGYFSSNTVHCKHCCEKKRSNGDVTYYHQMLGAVLVHPEQREVVPMAPEMILKEDGATKNDCERNAAKRLLTHVRREHPHLKMIVVEDGLASNAPHIRLLNELNYKYIIVAKEGDHRALFESFRSSKAQQTFSHTDEAKTVHHFRWVSDLPLNESNQDVRVNVLEYFELTDKGESRTWVWVTNIALTPKNVFRVMQGGRARWRIENETFNTLKNQGYHFEHNFGHGNNNLSTVMAYLMLLSFLIDQIQQRCCALFQAALLKAERKLYFWQKVRGLGTEYRVKNWEDLYQAIAYGYKLTELTPDTS